MVSAGCESIFDMTRHAAMLLGALRSVGKACKMMTACGNYLNNHAVDAAVVIDSPILHLPLAARAQSAGVPLLYYIAPQIWAWGSYRIHKLRNRCDRVAVILPFEEKYFRDQGVEATYVGHPLAEQLTDQLIDEHAVRDMRNDGSPFISLLPGSRKHVVQSILPGQLEVAQQISRALPRAAFGVSVANPQVASVIRELVGHPSVKVTEYRGKHAELIRASDLVLVASGTSTLEVALHNRPMIVMYNGSRLFYHLIARWMIGTPHLALPNILAGRVIVPEFMPYYTSTKPIATKAIELLTSEEKRQAIVQDLRQVTAPLRNTRASARTATMLLNMISHNGH
jgi:lipid-A-disaccharide synthase